MWKRKLFKQAAWIFGFAMAYLALPQELHVFERWVQEEPVDPSAWQGLLTPAARMVAFITGCGLALFSVFSAWLPWEQATRTKGISTAGPGFRVCADLLVLLLGTWLTTVALDAVWVGWLKEPSLLGLEWKEPGYTGITGLHFVSIPGLLVAWPLMSLYLTQLGGQVVRVSSGGVTVHGALSSLHLPWEELDTVSVYLQRNPVEYSTVDTRPLQKMLELAGGGVTLLINQPTSATRKQAILKALFTQIPEAKRPLLSDVSTSW